MNIRKGYIDWRTSVTRKLYSEDITHQQAVDYRRHLKGINKKIEALS